MIDVGPRRDDRLDRGLVLVAEIGGQDFDRGVRRVAAKRLDHLDELARAAVGQIVAVDAGDDDMLQAQFGRRDRDMLGLQRVDRARHPRLDVAEGAGPRAGVAEDHHRGVLLGPAFADVRAGRFLAHRGQAQLAHQPSGVVIAFADRRLDPDPVGLALARWHGKRCVHRRRDSDCVAPLPPLAAQSTRSGHGTLGSTDRRLPPLPRA